MFIQNLNGDLHQINEALYNAIEKRFVICEGDSVLLLEKNKSSVDMTEFVDAQLQQRNYDLSKIADKRQRDQIVKILSQKVSDDPANLKQIFDDFVANPDSLLQPQNQQPKEEPQSDNQNNQQSQEKTDNQNEQPQDNNQDTKTEQPNNEQQKVLDKNTKAILGIIHNSKYIYEILSIANKGEQEPKDIYDVDPTKLVDAAMSYRPFILELLEERLDAGLNKINASENMKKDIKNIFLSDCNKKGAIPNIIHSQAVKNSNPDMTIFDFPITKYYVNKYNQSITGECYDKLVKAISESIKNGNPINDNSDIRDIINKAGIDEKDINPNMIKSKLKKAFPESFIDYVLKQNNKFNDSVDIKELSAEDIAKIINIDEYSSIDVIKEAEMVIKKAFNRAAVLPYIGYIMTTTYNTKMSDEDNPAIKVNIYNDFSPSQLVQGMNDIIKESNINCEVGIMKQEISAYYDKKYRVKFTDRDMEEGSNTCIIMLLKGFPIINVLKNSFAKGQQKSRSMRNLLKIT